ncbi:MAG: hypothetical protein U9O94_00205 [Nanoarchaeota archaeon]|nr:hypothetical protein [Nanoarchaeota archaeon]
MGLFGKKKKEEEPTEEDPGEEKKEEPQQDSNAGGGAASLGQVIADLEKLKAQFNTFYEVNKASNERFTRINEQIGELRTMILGRDKESKMLEAKATQAIDLVQSVQPDKLMIEMRKGDSKTEALRASIESNEMVLNNATNELRQMRNKMQVFTGMEQVIKLNEEVKSNLMEIKKMNATMERHSDKVETIFSEMQKSFSDFSKFVGNLNDLDKSVKQTGSDLDGIKARITTFANKKEFEDLITKFNNFEKQVSSIMTLVNRKFDNLEKDLRDRFSERMEKSEKLLNGFQQLAQKTPDLDKYFNLLEEEAKKAPQGEEKVEKVKTPGEEEKEEGEGEKKPGLLSKLKGLKDKVAGGKEGGGEAKGGEEK